MAWSFGDGFDCYALPADAINGYWDSGTLVSNLGIAAGRFAGSQAFSWTSSSNAVLIKTSAVNDAVHHFACAFQQTAAISGSTLGLSLQLFDGATAQCSVVFRSDGAILLTSGGPAGTVLDTYTGAFPVINTWYAFEFEVIISNTVGRFRVRKNGNTSDDYDSTAIRDTQNSANAYANKLQISQSLSVNSQRLDDLFWRSDASSVPFVGDIRAYTRMPASDAAVQFARTPTSVAFTPYTTAATTAFAVNNAYYQQFIPTVDGTIATAILSVAVGYTGNLKCAIFASSGTFPTTVLGTATPISNPVSGNNTFTFGTPVTVSKGTQYWIGLDPDTSTGSFNRNGTLTGMTGVTPYASFPVASPGVSAIAGPIFTMNINVTTNNCLVNEAQQDAATSYVYDSTPGDQDFYGIASIASTPVNTIAVTTRALMQKSDAGSRTAAVQLRSGSTVVFSPTAWNPSDKTASLTLSGSNLIANATTSTQGVRAVSGFSVGKFYFEITLGSAAGAQAFVGLATAAASLSGVASTATGAVGIGTQSGLVFLDTSGVGPASIGSRSNGDVIGIAVDFGTRLIWFRVAPSGNWNGNAAYAPGGTGGVDFTVIGLPLYPIFSVGPGGGIVTANFGSSAFTGTVPSGYTAGFGGTIIGTTVASPTLTLTTSGWLWAWRTDTLDPNGNVAWSAAAVNGINVGPKVIA
jgi:hypothetical protein